MSKPEKCPNCGANFPLNSFVCKFCGYVESEKVKQISSINLKEISFDESLNVIQDNLNALHDINKPKPLSGVISVLRVITAIYTFGIVLLFWKKPKHRFNKGAYEKLKKIIKRNISLLKVSSIGSDDLLRRVKIVEDELKDTDSEIKRNLQAKQITTVITIACFVGLIILANIFDPTIDKDLFPIQNNVSGDLSKVLEIDQDAHRLTYIYDETISEIKLRVTFSPIEEFKVNNNTGVKIMLILTDAKGNESEKFHQSLIDNFDLDRLMGYLRRGSHVDYRARFNIRGKKSLTKFPEEISHFKIHTEIIKNTNNI